MATKKAGGTAKNLRDSQPKYLGTKLYDGEWAKTGSVIVRQRGTVIRAGKNVRTGKDHTLFSVVNGIVKFGSKRKTGFNNRTHHFKTVSVIPQTK
ncbi:MAG: 50S ribosomal protein L27 [Candidatus Vogelbacteria bacterium]|nr:50S ribosomal protein L27 [Candidatus Vogelbacteria bacterium]